MNFFKFLRYVFVILVITALGLLLTGASLALYKANQPLGIGLFVFSLSLPVMVVFAIVNAIINKGVRSTKLIAIAAYTGLALMAVGLLIPFIGAIHWAFGVNGWLGVGFIAIGLMIPVSLVFTILNEIFIKGKNKKSKFNQLTMYICLALFALGVFLLLVGFALWAWTSNLWIAIGLLCLLVAGPVGVLSIMLKPIKKPQKNT